jgi:chaperonin GroEL
MYTEPILGEEAFIKQKRGIDSLADTVRITMGVRGKSILLDTNEYTRPIITNDGATIARHFKLKDRTENNGVKRLREDAEKTNDEAGDGTTTTMVLEQEMIDEGHKSIVVGADGIPLRNGIKKATKKIVDYLRTEKVESSDIKSLAAVATISSRDANIGKLIAKVVKESGIDGVITIEDRQEDDTIYDKVEGLKLRGGFLGEFFVNLPERRQAVFNDVPILVTNRTITLATEMARIMEVVSNMGKKEAVIIANAIDGDALATAMANWHKKAIYILPLRVQTYAESGEGAVKDVASVTGAVYLDESEPKSLIDIVAEDFGRAAKTVTDKHETTIISNNNELKQKHIKKLKVSLNNAKAFEAESIRERISKLQSTMFTIKVGGRTETERNELKTRIDDAIKAAKAALEDGVVAGGGSSLYRAIMAQDKPDVTTDEGIGEQVVYKALLSPIKQMAINSGYTLDKGDFKSILDKKKVINFKTCRVVNAYKDGILDPLKVVISCVKNSASGAGIFLTLGGVVVEHQEEVIEKI